MNYLAHTLLSKKSIDYQIANLSSDATKGRAWPGCSQLHLEGLAMHRSIDSFTDSNSHFIQAKSRLGRGYLKGVVLDITFDHFVRKHWDNFVSVDFEDFVVRFNTEANIALAELPPVAHDFIQRAMKYQFLRQYEEFSDLEKVFERVNRRLSDKILAKESATDYYPRLAANYVAIEQDFLAFFPELIAFFIAESQAMPAEHYFKLA